MRNRFDLVEERLESRRWRRLFNEVKASRPDYVILVARKIPRLYQLMQTMPGAGIPTLPVCSDLAISHLPSLANARVAVVDDVINVGTTVAMAAQRLKNHAKAREVRCYALERRQNPHQLNIREYADSVEYESDSPIEEDEYRESTKDRAKALMLLNRPFEIGFPVFRLRQKGGFNLDRFRKGLANFGEKAHRIDEPASAYAGLTRYSIDLNTERGINDKWRFYIDEAREEICFAPMLQLFGQNDMNEASDGRHADLYACSLRFGYASQPVLKEKLGIADMRLMAEETNLAFGMQPDGAATAKQEAPGLDAILGREITGGGSFLAEWSQSDSRRQWLEENSQVGVADRMISFFNKLGEDQRCDDPDTENATLEELYGRLRRGPTFQELVAILGDTLQAASSAPGKLHWQVSQMLDEQIDQGFVVPTISKEGERVFRKGEPAPYNRMDVRIARSLGLPEKTGEDWREWRGIAQKELTEFMEIRKQLQ